MLVSSWLHQARQWHTYRWSHRLPISTHSITDFAPDANSALGSELSTEHLPAVAQPSLAKNSVHRQLHCTNNPTQLWPCHSSMSFRPISSSTPWILISSNAKSSNSFSSKCIFGNTIDLNYAQRLIPWEAVRNS